MHNLETFEMPPLTLDGRFLPDTLNVEKRTVEMVFATETPVRTFNFTGNGFEEFNEVLSMDEGSIRMQRLLNGAPLLNCHLKTNLSHQIGVVERAWLQEGQLRGLVRFSKREDVEPFFQDVVDGIIQNGSIGYRVYRYEDISEEDFKIRTLKAIDWEPFEMTLLPVGADANSGVREHKETIKCDFLLKSREVKLPQPEEKKPTPKPPEINVTEERKKIRAEEKKRALDIRSEVKKAGLESSFAENLVEQEISLDQARALIIDKVSETRDSGEINSQLGRAEITRDENETRMEGIQEALMARAFPNDYSISEKSRNFESCSLIEIAKANLRHHGESDTGNKLEVVTRAFHSTSDFPMALSNVANKSAMKGYSTAPATHKIVGRRTTMPDFKEKTVARMGEFPSLEKVPQGGEVKFGSFGDKGEKYALATYAKNIAITRQMIINDDLDEITRIPLRAGRAGGDLERLVFWSQIKDSPKMSDGYALFHASKHKNIAASGLALDEDSLSAAEAAMMSHVDEHGRPLSIQARYLVVNQFRKTAAKKLIASVSKEGGNNPFAGEFEVVVVPELTAANNPWYLFADHNQVDTAEYAYLEGVNGLFIEEDQSINVHGMVIRVTLDFAAKAIDWVGMYKNPGA